MLSAITPEGLIFPGRINKAFPRIRKQRTHAWHIPFSPYMSQHILRTGLRVLLCYRKDVVVVSNLRL